jgi:hypothetical protein
MATLDTVAKYVTSARVLLQDTVAPYRYADDELVLAFSMGLMDARKLRPDLFLDYFREEAEFPSYTTNDSTDVSFIDEQYRTAFLYYIVGHAQLRDDEPTQDSRASALLNKFTQSLAVLA